MKRRVVLILALVAGLGLLALYWLRAPQLGAAERGARRAESLGCVACHGPDGRGGIANPGSAEREVPGFAGGTTMMYLESPDDLRGWILDGRPARLDAPMAGPKALLKMPAYRDRLDAEALDELIAWYRAVAAYTPEIPEAAADGRRAARKAGCFGCHGPGGLIGRTNAGALKGYVPAWGSPDYFALVKDDAELRAWILDGAPERIRSHPIAQWFTQRQHLKMPAYRDVLDLEQVDAIIVYIRWLARQP